LVPFVSRFITGAAGGAGELIEVLRLMGQARADKERIKLLGDETLIGVPAIAIFTIGKQL